MRVFLLLLLLVGVANAGISTFSNNIDMRTGFNVAPQPAPPSPSLIAQTLNISSPANLGDNVGSIGGTNTPTMWAMTGCAGCAGYFNTDQTTGQITIAQGGATALNGTVDLVNLFPVTVTASNAGGTAQVDETIKVYALPLITAKTVGVAFPLPATTSVITTATATRGSTTITGWSITNCTPACANWFVINNAGQIKDTTTGQSNAQANTTYTLTVAATNPGGSTSNQIALATQGVVGPPQVTAQTKVISTPAANLDPVLTVSATNNPTLYSVTSCVPGCTGFFQFATQSDPHMTISATGAANLTGAVKQNGPFSVLVTASNGATSSGSATMTITGYADGFVNRPVGATAQLPTVLNGKVARAPWKVAGIDYGVGPPSSTVFKDPATMGATVPGCSANTGTHLVTCSSGAPTLNGWNFGTAGWSVVCTTPGLTITNSKFLATSGPQSPINANSACTGLVVTNNLVNGNGFDTDHGLVFYQGNSATNGAIIQYNYLINAGRDIINIDNVASVSMKASIRYNLMQNAGEVAGAHGDIYQPQGGHYNIIIDFNTVFQQQTAQGGQGINPGDNGPVDTAGSVSYNTMITSPQASAIGPGTSNLDAFIGLGAATVTTAFPVINNYFDPTAMSFAGGALDCGRCFSGSTKNSFTTYAGNINMNNGATVPGP